MEPEINSLIYDCDDINHISGCNCLKKIENEKNIILKIANLEFNIQFLSAKIFYINKSIECILENICSNREFYFQNSESIDNKINKLISSYDELVIKLKIIGSWKDKYTTLYSPK